MIEPIILHCEPGAVHVSYSEAGECGTCHTMHHFFVQRGTGPSQCIYCDTQPSQSQQAEPHYDRALSY